MSLGLRYFVCDDFPRLLIGQAIETSVHLALPWGDDTAATRLEMLGIAADDRFERYSVLHQVERDIDAFFNHKPIRRVLQNQRFDAFYNRQLGYFLLNCNQKDARGVFERLRTINPPVVASPGETDLNAVVSTLGKVTGAYFGNLRIAKVRGAALFGDTTVVESEEFEHYKQLGELSVVYMRLIGNDKGEMRSMQLMADRSVVLHQHWGEKRNLEFVAELQTELDKIG